MNLSRPGGKRRTVKRSAPMRWVDKVLEDRALDLEEISVRDVIVAAEGKAPAVFDCSSYAATCPNGAIGTCSISPFLMNFQTKIDGFLDGLMLSDIL